MKTVILCLAFGLFAVDARCTPQGKQTFTGTITDSMCPKADHSQMQMGPSDAACAMACNDVHGAAYVLYDGKSSYELSDEKTAAKFAGQKVKVAGMLDAKTKTIHVESITAAK